MSFIRIITEPAIIIITSFFLFFLVYLLINYRKIEKNLRPVAEFLKSLGKLSFLELNKLRLP